MLSHCNVSCCLSSFIGREFGCVLIYFVCLQISYFWSTSAFVYANIPWSLLISTFLRFLVLSSGIIYGYYAMILKIDEEDFGGHGALLQEGLFVSVMLFLVCNNILFLLFSLLQFHLMLCGSLLFCSFHQLAWILVYSLVHFWFVGFPT